jgi:hypothetical protein
MSEACAVCGKEIMAHYYLRVQRIPSRSEVEVGVEAGLEGITTAEETRQLLAAQPKTVSRIVLLRSIKTMRAVARLPDLTQEEIERIIALPTYERKALFIDFDCNEQGALRYLTSHLAYGQVYKFIWSPANVATGDTRLRLASHAAMEFVGKIGQKLTGKNMLVIEGIVENADDIAAALKSFPLGGKVERPYGFGELAQKRISEL